MLDSVPEFSSDQALTGRIEFVAPVRNSPAIVIDPIVALPQLAECEIIEQRAPCITWEKISPWWTRRRAAAGKAERWGCVQMIVAFRIDAFARQQGQQRGWVAGDQTVDEELRLVRGQAKSARSSRSSGGSAASSDARRA